MIGFWIKIGVVCLHNFNSFTVSKLNRRNGKDTMSNSNSKRVLVIATTFPRWQNDTTPAFVYELSKRLQNNGFKIFVLAPHHNGAEKFEIMDGMRIYRFPYFWPEKYQKLAYEGGILPNIKRSNLSKIQVPFLFLSELYYTFKLIKKERIDVIHTHWIIPNGLIGAFCKKFFGIRHILTIHAAGLFALEQLPFKKNIANFIVNNSDEITVVSSYIKERLINVVSPALRGILNDKLKIIPMGVHVELYQKETDVDYLKSKNNIRSKFSLLFIGRLAEKKGVKFLIKAMARISLTNKDVTLIICGDGPLRKELQQQVSDLKLRDFVRFTGYITDNEKLDYLKLSDILIVPSIVTEFGDTEGLPVVILEGLAAGKPIIASDVSGIKDVITDGVNGFLIEPNNPDQIAKKVLELLKNTESMMKISKSALNTVDEYDWKIIGGKYGKTI